MAIIGRNTVGSATEVARDETAVQLISLRDNIWTATAEQEVFRFGFYAGSSFTGNGTVSMALYDMSSATSDTDPDGAVLIASVSFAAVDITADSFNTKDITAVALSQNTKYAVAFKVDTTPTGDAYFMRENIGGAASTYNSDDNGSTAFQDPFNHTSGTEGTNEYVVWAETRSTGANITNISDPITTGQNFTIDGSNFGATQGASNVTVGGVSCSIVSWGDLQIIATCPNIESTNLAYGNQTVRVSVG